ncbi:hypothetical protein C8R46DRAFT_994980 [Mycena filopes]|nr:hypothetical protein C8R46DRAFT_994980 [Mycena filopes]
MSIWQIGKNEVTEEVQAFKNKLSSKETQIAAQQNDILKQAAELADLKSTLNDTIHKLNHEAARAISLESTLAKSTEDLRNESLAAQNAAAALLAAQEKLKAKALEARELEATLESISHKSNTFNARGTKLEKEKATLEARVRELEANLRQLSSPAPTVPTTPRHRRRSSSVSDTRITTLERELKEARATLVQRETELRGATAKLGQAQTDLVKVENDKVAADKRLQGELRDLRVALQDKSEELEYMKEQQGDSAREEELLRRIDEDDATIAALKKLLADAPETADLKERLRRLEQRLLIETERASEMETRQIELVREKEEALDELEEAEAKLSDALRQKESQQPSGPSVEQDVERLLGAIDRIRGERDDARRTLEFQEVEAKFAVEALQARIATLAAAAPAPADSQVDTQVQLLQEQLAAATIYQQSALHEKNREAWRMGRAAMASAVVIQHLRSQEGLVAEQLLNASTASENAMEDACRRLKEVELQLRAAAEGLEAMTRQRDELLAQIALKETDWRGELERVKAAHKDAIDELAGSEPRFKDAERLLNDITAERDSLNLQVANLSADLDTARRELTAAETRYSTLQFHQLSSMTSNEATTTLRGQLAEQEKRLARRTEDLSILRHDNERLETNLRLQEERLSEMVMELEVLATEKDAMVDDCADARQARDAAIARVEELEVEMEGRLEAGDVTLCAVVGVVVQTVGRSRQALRELGARAIRASREARAESIDWATRVAELDTKHRDLQVLVSNMEAGHHTEVERLTEQQAEKDRLVGENDLEGELAQLRVKHVEEMGVLQGRLVETTSALDEAQARCEAAEEDYRQVLSDSTRSREELESAAEDAAKQIESLRVDLGRTREEHATAIETMNARVKAAVSESEEVRVAHRELEGVHQNTVSELAQARETLSALEARVAELESQLEEQTAEADTLRQQLEEETEARALEQEERNAAESSSTRLKQELSAVSAELFEARSEVESAEEERTTLQEEVTTLQAEIQRSLSLCRYLENQVKESEQVAASLTADLEQVRVQHARAEKTGKAAEVNLSLQNAQHRREMSELQRQLAALQSQPDLSGVIADLEERNNEMEELLKLKCAEIEENDDRALEMLKSNKKLTTKVESLTRKVQNLQAKLAAAKASNPGVPAEAPEYKASPSLPNIPTRQRSNTLSAVPPVPSLPAFALPTPGRGPSNRVASGSALPRPKTPERKVIPVFKAQTPERRIAPIPPSPSAPVLGQKRRAPDDFEDVNVPTQGFTPESLPDENGTPRARRMLTGLHSGFTPVRQSARAAALPASRSSNAYIADVTNSPRLGDTAKSKRSWLGKIRNTSRAAPGDL